MFNPEHSPRHLETSQDERETAATRFLALSEEMGRILDELVFRPGVPDTIPREAVAEAAVKIRHEVFRRACEILGVSDEERSRILGN